MIVVNARLQLPVLRDPAPWRAGLVWLVRAGVALVGMALAGCQASGDQPFVLARPVALDERQPVRIMLGGLRYEAGFVLTSDDARFGGLSGLWIAPDGDELAMVSDRGTIWRARLEHIDDQLIRFHDWSVTDLEPAAMDGGRRIDAEALAQDAAGDLIMAVEGRGPLRRLPPGRQSGAAELMTGAEGLDEVGAKAGNTGIEALTSLPEGALLAISEGVIDGPGRLAAWRIEDGRLEPLQYAVSGGFVPTGADRLDDVIYVVERRFSMADGGFASRLMVLDTAQIGADAPMAGDELAELAWPTIHDNFEGIAVRKATDGRVLLYLVSDDNFLPLQRTLLLQFSLEP